MTYDDDMDERDRDGPSEALATQEAAGAVVRQGFGSTEIQRGAETMGAALASAARAAIEARYVVAMRQPRNPVAVRERLLSDCRRPTFADVAIYRIKRGKVKNGEGRWIDNFIEGPTIRFAEAARQAFRNLHTEAVVIYEDPDNRLLQVTTTDLETNITESGSVMVAKTIEKSKVWDSDQVLSRRQNSEGKVVYTVAATADQVNERQNSLVSKLKRNQILALIPGDLKAEALDECRKTSTDTTRRQLPARRQSAKAAFEKIGVDDPALTRYLGHPITEATADELDELRELLNGIKEGSARWSEVLAQVERDRAATPPAVVDAASAPVTAAEPPKTSPPPSGNAAARAAMRKAADE